MEEATRPATPWHRSPFWLAVVGLALMFAGYQVSSYVPEATPNERRQADEIGKLRDMAEDDALRGKLDDYARDVRQPPPYRWPGRLLMLAGAMMAVSAAVIMARQPSRQPQEPAAPEPDDLAAEDRVEADRLA
jgi:hypothetical protein